MTIKTRIVCLALVPVLPVACATTSRSLTRGIKESPEMVKMVLRSVPPGTPIDAAERFMRSEGFHCTKIVNDSFGERSGIDYLSCSRSEGKGFVRRVWKIAIIDRGGRVAEILAKTGLEAP
jgi:hypothetical protein